jgi:type II secretory pathway pseudopilin PulG
MAGNFTLSSPLREGFTRTLPSPLRKRFTRTLPSPSRERGNAVRLPSACCQNRGPGGWTLLELLASAIVLSFLVASSATLYSVWQRQSLLARNYSQAQTDLRTAFRIMLRTIRHGTTVVATSSSGTINGKVSNASQIVVHVPESGSASADVVFYVDSAGTLYYQRDTDATPTSMITGVKTISIHYFQTTTTVSGTGTLSEANTEVAGAPASATEVQIALTVRSGGPKDTTNEAAVTTVQSYVTLRNTTRLESTTPQ